MNSLVIPPSPNWYEANVSVCAPDNTLLYGARNDLVVIKPTPAGQPDDVQILTRAHNTRVISVNINKNWGQPNKLAATVSEDNIIKLWNIETLEKKLSHNMHINHDPVRGAAFAGDDRVVSVAENGIVVVWNIVHNETNVISSLFEGKVAISCLSICPHASWLAAFGLKTGLVIVADLRKTGRIVYKLRGHDKSVVSLSWCPVPINVFPVKPQNIVGAARTIKEITEVPVQDSKAIGVKTEENDKDHREVTPDNNEEAVCKPTLKENPWANIKFADDDEKNSQLLDKEEDQEKDQEKDKDPVISDADDYLRECLELRNQILKMSSPEPTKTEVSYSPEGTPRVILKARSRGKTTEVDDGNADDEDKLADNCNSSFDSAISSKKKNTDQSDNDSSCDLNVTGSSKKSTDLSETSFLTADDLLDDKNIEIVETVEKSDNDKIAVEQTEDTVETVEKSDEDKAAIEKTEENPEMTEVDVIVMNLKNKFKEHKAKKDVTSSVASDNSSTLLKREIIVDQKCETEEPRKEFLLASSAKEGAIYIWRAGTDGRLQMFFNVPNPKTYGKKKFENIWITVCWIAPNMLLSSSKNGELLQWNLPKPREFLYYRPTPDEAKEKANPSKQIRSIHKDHWGLIFNLTGPITLLDAHNWLKKDRKLNVWSLGQDRMVINTDLGKETTNLASYPTLGGCITCFAGSPVDPNRLAIGTSDAEIRIWDLSREHTKRIVFSRYHNKIQSKVTCLAWHPVVEMSLAYGTQEGRVGIIDTGNQNKMPKLLPDFFNTQAYKVEWGPKPDCKDFCLYVVAQGKVVIFDTKKETKDPILLDVPDNTVVYTFSWKPDYKMLIVSAKSGALITYTADLNIHHIYYLHEKLCSIVWHPDACSEDTSVSKYSKVFASVVKNYQCVIYDLSIESEQNDDKILAKFDNKNALITSMSWSPHNGNHLVIADECGVAQVYDIETKTVLATYADPDFDNIVSVVWSPVDPDFIINGLSRLVVWKISDYPPLAPEEIEARKKQLARDQKKEQADQVSKEKLEEKEAKESKSTKPTKSAVLPVFYGIRPDTQSSDIRKLIDYKDGVQNMEPRIGDANNVDVLQVFGKNSDMVSLIDTNISTLRQRGKQVNSNILALWKGDITTEIKEAIEVKRVNPQLIVMCATFAPKLLQNACEVYIEQLMDRPDSDPIEIVTYLLACHKVEESVNVLCDNQLFKEALALAKCRLPQDDPIILAVLEKWAKSNVYSGNFELAAMCYVTLGKFEDASSVLFRRSTLELLQLSADLAEKSGNQEFYKAIMFRLNAFKNHIETEETPTTPENGLSASPKSTETKKVLENGTACKENSMLPEVLVNELEHFKHCESQVFDRVVEEDYLYQVALTSQGFLQQQKIQNILRKSLSPTKNVCSLKKTQSSPEKNEVCALEK